MFHTLGNDCSARAATHADLDMLDLLRAQHGRIEELLALSEGGIGWVRQDAFDELVRLLSVHEAVEERLVHPLVRNLANGHAAAVGDRLREERELKRLLAGLIRRGVGDPHFRACLLVLREAVLTHLRNEEQYEFPVLRKEVSALRLRRLAAAARVASLLAPTRPHPRVCSAIGNYAFGPALGMVDRVRDMIRDTARQSVH